MIDSNSPKEINPPKSLALNSKSVQPNPIPPPQTAVPPQALQEVSKMMEIDPNALPLIVSQNRNSNDCLPESSVIKAKRWKRSSQKVGRLQRSPTPIIIVEPTKAAADSGLRSSSTPQPSRMLFLSDAAEGCWINAALPLTICYSGGVLLAGCGSCGQWWCREGRGSVDGSGPSRLRRIWLWRSELGTLPLQLGILDCDLLRILGRPLR
ncbi:SWAP (Suppressor-of-White-APricot)/surpdomain-containing protein [Striga asiatica]|uniref:SWAP (Suppressor-of-White-APricot)/surpdomain-containing protein n=1 Tax=Striga asiatica TaxID=4170 RepID=A0A5A7Q2U6_STRAF|nr:SWAP (Suppressor-of-White-APricot)/surpdomain-containing protein [Striga asiatica]